MFHSPRDVIWERTGVEAAGDKASGVERLPRLEASEFACGDGGFAER